MIVLRFQVVIKKNQINFYLQIVLGQKYGINIAYPNV